VVGSKVSEQCTCACGTRADGSTDHVGCSSGRMAVSSLSASENNGAARSKTAADSPAALVHSYGVVMLLSGDVTYFWTVTDNPNPFCCHRPNYSFCPSGCVGNALALFKIAAGFLDVGLNDSCRCVFCWMPMLNYLCHAMPSQAKPSQAKPSQAKPNQSDNCLLAIPAFDRTAGLSNRFLNSKREIC